MNIKSFLLSIVLLCGSISSAHAGFLQFPISGYSSSTAPVTAVMDHDGTNNGSIKTYTGEVGYSSYGCKAWVGGQAIDCNSANTGSPRAYKRSGGAQWSVPGMNYVDYTDVLYNRYMWYDGHHGYDYAVPQWTTVVAAASGVVVAENFNYGQITIDHGNGYRTTYTHMYMNQCSSTVTKGQVIGWVSNVSPTPVGVHLHFVAQRYIGGVWTLVDPYGGSGQPALWQ